MGEDFSFHIFSCILTLLPPTFNKDLLLQAPSVGSGEASLPGVVEQMQPQFISRFLEGQSGVTIKSVSCGDLFTTCMTGSVGCSTLYNQLET